MGTVPRTFSGGDSKTSQRQWRECGVECRGGGDDAARHGWLLANYPASGVCVRGIPVHCCVGCPGKGRIKST
eukprot:97410-Pyramimonas_sp.AAC.1